MDIKISNNARRSLATETIVNRIISKIGKDRRNNSRVLTMARLSKQQRKASKESVSTLSIEENSLTRVPVRVLVLSVLIAAISYVLLNSNSSQTRNETTSFNVTATVPVTILSSPSSKFAQSCAEASIPIILKSSISTQWKAKQWTPEYLENKMNNLSGIYENDNRWFGPYFDKKKPLLEYAHRINDYKTNVQLTSKQFFDRIQKVESNSFLYFTGNIEQLGPWAIDEIRPFDELLTLNPSHSSVNAWIGQPHVIAHCHYDGYHNFYTQLYGRKRFLLLRPTSWPGVYPYPFLHPSHAQAQVNVSNEMDRRHFILASKLEVFEAVLEPGDVLYIPPLWFHEVESLQVSISVNVWTDSVQTKLAEALFQLFLPIHSVKWSSERTKRIATSFVLFQTLQKTCTHQNCVRSVIDVFADNLQEDSVLSETGALYFIHRLWSTRYRTLMARKELPNTFPDRNGILCEKESSTGQEIEEAKAAIHTHDFGVFVKTVGELVQEFPGETWELWVGNYVEFVVANALPGVEYVGVFLKHFSTCFA